METTKIPLGDKIITIRWDDFDDDIEVADILRIDYSNITGELITFPLIINRLGMLRSEADAIVNQKKLDMDVIKARRRRFYRGNGYIEKNAQGIKKLKSLTKDEVDDLVTIDEEYKSAGSDHLDAIRKYNNVDSLYWAAKSKDTKLKVFERNGFVVEDHLEDIVDKTINGIPMTIKGKLYKKRV